MSRITGRFSMVVGEGDHGSKAPGYIYPGPKAKLPAEGERKSSVELLQPFPWPNHKWKSFYDNWKKPPQIGL